MSTFQMTTFNDLCSDILLEIFSYFSLNELFNIFIELIPYLPELIFQGHVQLCIDKNADRQFWTKCLVNINHDQIIALNIFYSNINEINLERFPYLRSMIIEDFRMIKHHPIDQLKNLMYLQRLSVKLSETVLNENSWLCHILELPVLKQLKIDSMVKKNTILPQRDIQISRLPIKSLTIKCLQIQIPLQWTSIISLLHHFPCLQIFHAYLYQIHSNPNDILLSKPDLTCFQSLKILHLTGYFPSMSSIIIFFCSSILNLKTCRLMSTSATNDNLTRLIRLRKNFFWHHLFQTSKCLTQVKIHLLISIDSQKCNDIDYLKERLRAFNNHEFCKQYDLHIIQTSMDNGYLTLMCDFNKRKSLNI